MPIADDRLLSDVNAYVIVPAAYTVREALRHWSKPHARWGVPREWWWLVIDYGSQQFMAIPLEQLRDLLTQADATVTLDTRLTELPESKRISTIHHPTPGLVRAKAVDKGAYSTAAALNLAENSPGQVLVVTEQGVCVGIISRRMRSFAMANQSLLKLLEEDEMRQQSKTTSAPSEADSTPPSSKPRPNQ